MNQPDPQSWGFDKVMWGIESGTLKIPQFQRDFVWPREKSAKLIDSILKGFPIGTFILWKTREQLRFVKEIGGQALPPTPKGDYSEQVLDGQQRLTSLYAACKGLAVTRDERAPTTSARSLSIWMPTPEMMRRHRSWRSRRREISLRSKRTAVAFVWSI